jgi:hypothetical protein
MSHNQYFSQCQPRKTRKSPMLIACVIAAIVLFYGWMGSRDAEPQLSVVTYDCAPAMDMSMPIDVGRVQL